MKAQESQLNFHKKQIYMKSACKETKLKDKKLAKLSTKQKIQSRVSQQLNFSIN